MTNNEVHKSYDMPFIYDRIVWAIADVFEDVNLDTARMMLFEFEDTHGSEAIVAMYGYIRYVILSGEGEEDRAIKRALAHDLQGRNDKFMLPTTSEYFEFALK